jgi:sugar phosphate isomerase/epimerase
MYNDDVWGRSGPDAVIDITEPLKSKRMKMVEEIKRALEIAETVPFRYLIQHLGMKDAEFNDRAVEAAFSSLEEIVIFARQRGVEVLIENTPNELSTAERLLMFFELTHLNLNVCFDTGHAHMHEGVVPAYRRLKSRIRSIHVHDNNGKEDQHLPPLLSDGVTPLDGARNEGTIDWSRAMQALRSQPNQYPLLLELKEVPALGHPVDAARRVFDRLEELRVPDES